MRITYKYIIIGITAAVMAACAKDGEVLTVSNPEAATGLTADPVEKTLLLSEKSNLGMTFYWTAGAGATVSNPSAALPDGLVTSTLDFAADQTFENAYSYALDSDESSAQFTVEALNNIVLRLGATEETAVKVYVRVTTTLGKTSVHSDAISVTLTPYIGDSGVMNMKDKDSGEFFATLHNTSSNPDRYEGFAVTTTGWKNFYFVASDGTAWGEDANWTAFVVEKQGDTDWRNCWFAGTTGCHYVFLDTKLGEWWHVTLPTVTVNAGGAEAKMKFSPSAKTWTGVFTTTEANATVKVGGTGAMYDRTVGTDASATPIDWPFTFVASGSGFSLAQGEASSNITAGAAGTYTLTFNVETLEMTLESGGDAPQPESYPADLYAWYYKKEASDKLDKATLLNGVTGDEGHYQGFLYTSPDWSDEQSGFRFLTSDGEDATDYHADSEGQYVLTTEAGGWNFWSSHPGLNYVTVDLTAKSWAETQVKHIAVSGDFNDWKIADFMTYDTATRKWTITCDINKIEWGIKFVLEIEDGDWKWQYGDPDNDGTLELGKDGFKPAETGTYKIELDLSSFNAPTYKITKQ
jgi:starch-binding outer membrane protein SusE/F